jgi:hypothetical protein
LTQKSAVAFAPLVANFFEADSAPGSAWRWQGEPKMIDARRPQSTLAASRDFPLVVHSPRDLDAPDGPLDAPESRPVVGESRIAARTDARVRRVAAEILRSVQSRLPGRVRDLKVRIVDDQFVLSGVSTSYYVKQVAQHVAMSALDSVMLGRLVNEIEVRATR